MATKFSSTLIGTNATDADFRAWCTFIHELLTLTGGWVNTADSGQIDLATVTRPTAGNQKRGYKVYRMNDALQGSAPVYVRLDFGSGSAVNNVGVWVTIGTGSDGAGTITNILFNGGAQTGPTVANQAATLVSNSYGSADSGRVALGLFVRSAGLSGEVVMWTLERTIDASGARTSAGLIMWWKTLQNATAGIDRGQYIDLAGGGSQPPTETGLSWALSTANPSAYGSDIGVAVPIPFRGIAQQPGTQVAIVRSSDFVVEASFTMSLYGVARLYKHLGTLQVNTPAAVLDSQARACIQYD